MCISKISRRLIVAIFTVFIILLILTSVILTLSNFSLNSNILSKIIYIISLIVFVIIYAFTKEKLNKKKIKKTISLTYRYIYLISITTIVKVISVYNVIPNVTKCEIMLYTVISILSAISLKKIIYNISKSDLLSVCAMLMYSLLPNIVVDKTIYFNMICVTFFVLLVIQFMQKLIDELKQLGIKTSKYMILSVITGVFIGCSMLFNINSLIWIILAVILIFIISNLDKTHINFSNKMINALRQKSKEMLYSLERIYIPKIIISVFIISYFSYLTYILLNFVIYKVDVPVINNTIISMKTDNNIIENIKEFKNIQINEIVLNFKNLVNTSKGYFLTLSIYILFIEILTVILRRRYDTKSTIIKMLFILLVTFYSLFGLNVYIYSHIISMLLILISIINTSNLYLNRDERIKLLNS